VPAVRPRAGQHFLADPLIATDIVAAADLTPVDDVLEIGPGRGALTAELLAAAAHVTAVELDEVLATELRRRFPSEPRLTVVCASVLSAPPDEFLAEGGRHPPYIVVANLPYYITAPVMRQLLEGGPRPSRLVLMVQREVAEAIAGRHGLSLLGVSVQVFGAVRELFRVPPSAFRPPPRVDSAVVRIDVYDQPQVPEPELDGFFTVVRAGFRAPRKQLHNALGSGLWLPPGEAPRLLTAAGIEPARRAATLSIAEWLQLYRTYEQRRIGYASPANTGGDAEEQA
jgi:16S rRNA (adenine1518-N6/adenine1519-N6)-dimethyltransferase